MRSTSIISARTYRVMEPIPEMDMTMTGRAMCHRVSMAISNPLPSKPAVCTPLMGKIGILTAKAKINNRAMMKLGRL